MQDTMGNKLQNVTLWGAYANQLDDYLGDRSALGHVVLIIQFAKHKIYEGITFKFGLDHADPISHDYKVFLNPSTTDVVCITTAEALALGKIVICAYRVSNEFFKQFANCRTFKDGETFVEVTRQALFEQPAPLTESQMHELSWDSTTSRFLKAAELDKAPEKKLTKLHSKSFMSSFLSLHGKLEGLFD